MYLSNPNLKIRTMATVWPWETGVEGLWYVFIHIQKTGSLPTKHNSRP